jgi:hypothetical protein
MESVVGILKSPREAERVVQGLKSIGIENSQINVLTPEANHDDVSEIPTTETEQPGTAAAMGGVVGGAIGAAGGLSMGAAMASLFVPGVGPVLAIGLAAGAILGAGGAVGGAVAGKALEDSIATGLPIDELFVYEDALRQGRTIVIAFLEDALVDRAREIMRDAGAESVDAARENWWVGLRDDELVAYSNNGDDFKKDETSYRHGFESALHPKLGRKPYAEAANYLRSEYPDEYADEAFRRGYRRGYFHYRELRTERQR